MFPYTVKYTESEYDIQNNNLLYKIDQKHQNTFELLKDFGNSQNEFWSIYTSSIIHILYLDLGDFVDFGMLGRG